MAHENEVVGNAIWNIAGIKVHADTVLNTWITMGIILFLAIISTRGMTLMPAPPSTHGNSFIRFLQNIRRRAQSIAELAIEFTQHLVNTNVPPVARGCYPVIGTLFLFILLSNLLFIIPGRKPPTSDLSFTAGLALIVFMMTVYYGIKSKGIGKYLKSFIEPNIAFLPLNIMETITKPLTLAMRLFGNIFAGEMLVFVIAILARLFVPVLFQLFNTFIGVIQAYLFVMLSLAYITVAVEEE